MADIKASDSACHVKKRNIKSKGKIRERLVTPPVSHSDEESSASSDDESGHTIKRRRKNTSSITASSARNNSSNRDPPTTTFIADRNTPITNTNDATKQSNWFDEDSKEVSTKAVGPIKAPTNVRTITVMDFSPDVCKDYKQTGFCGFGDNCKFLHAREDYKQGWQLDREWENVTKGKRSLNGIVIASADRENGREESAYDKTDLITQQIVTQCGHYFCERCALTRYRKDPSCAACGAGTNGVFNSAKQLRKILDTRRQ
ncbi:pre-mRNA splicing factor cwc24 [Xylogone sp. PMI_703]|nr:pre-mRNA splicing factor cwc24 [Xylogone sp. PMI_703]